MAIDWYSWTTNGYGQIGIEWNFTSYDTYVTYAPVVYAWSKYNSSDSSVGYSWELKVDGSVVSSGSNTISWNLPSNTTVQIDSFTTRTAYRKADYKVPFELKLSFSGGNITSDNAINGSHTWFYDILESNRPSQGTFYEVTYNTVGGSPVPPNQTKVHDVPLKITSIVPKQQYHVFGGWKDMTNGDNRIYSPGELYTRNANVKLQAMWSFEKYVIRYDANGGFDEPADQEKTYSLPIKLSEQEPYKPDYNFIGWSTSPYATSAEYRPGEMYTKNSPVTLYAVWSKDYSLPKITNVEVYRSNSSGTHTDTGTFARVKFSWSSAKTVRYIYVKYKHNNASSWTSLKVPATGTSGTVDKVIGSGELTIEDNWDVEIEVADADGSSSLTRIVPSISFVIDFKANGTGVSFGKSAVTDDIVDSAWRYQTTANNIKSSFGARSTNRCNWDTDAPGHHMNKPLYVQGDIYGGPSYNKKVAYIDDLFPVGTILIRYDKISPASLYGGYWTRIESAFLYGARSSDTIGGTGGVGEVTLSVSQMPSHRHITKFDIKEWSAGGYYISTAGYKGDYSFETSRDSDYVGGSSSHTNMPPYVKVYIWRRTS